MNHPIRSKTGHLNNRKNPRKRLLYPAWIDLGDPSSRLGCVIADISDIGAKLTISKPEDLPDNFGLSFAIGAETHRRCHIVWRSEVQVGVRFIRDVPPAPRAAKHSLDC